MSIFSSVPPAVAILEHPPNFDLTLALDYHALGHKCVSHRVSFPMASTSTATISTSFTTKRSGRSTRKGKEREVNVLPYTNLLGAGTLSFTLHGLTSYFDDNAVAEDGWYILKDFLGIRTCVEEDRVWILDCLLFLQTNAFVQATYTILSNSMLMVRIYLVPYDLPGSKGALRNRDEMKVMIPGRKALRELLAHLSKDTASWMGSERSSKFVSFFEDQDVSCNTSPIVVLIC